MLGWKKQKIALTGSVLFRGALPPRLDELRPQLAAAGVDVAARPAAPDAHWQAQLRHPQWGEVEATCLRNFPRVPRDLVAFDPRLSPAERDAAVAAPTTVAVRLDAPQGDVLRDRKRLLRFLAALLDPYDEGALAVDHGASKFWPRAALADELSHDAALDIESVFVTHCVYEPSDAPASTGEGAPSRRVYWMHTHGLAELGAHDFDVLRPAPILAQNGYNVILSLAHALLEGSFGPETARAAVFSPGGEVGLVPVERFTQQAPAAERALRDAEPGDRAHAGPRRLVVCDPLGAGGSWWKQLLGRGGGVRASRAMQHIDGERFVVLFSNAATELMAERARQTLAAFRAMVAEFATFEVQPLVKLGVQVDGATSADDREHLWYEVHAFPSESTVDATLVNEPFRIARLKAGERATWDVGLLTDWTILTPAGPISPRSFVAARRLRAHLAGDRSGDRSTPMA